MSKQGAESGRYDLLRTYIAFCGLLILIVGAAAGFFYWKASSARDLYAQEKRQYEEMTRYSDEIKVAREERRRKTGLPQFADYQNRLRLVIEQTAIEVNATDLGKPANMPPIRVQKDTRNKFQEQGFKVEWKGVPRKWVSFFVYQLEKKYPFVAVSTLNLKKTRGSGDKDQWDVTLSVVYRQPLPEGRARN